MLKGKARIEYTNPDEITKSRFDKLKKLNDFDVFTKEQYAMTLSAIQGLIKKGETQELGEEEITFVNEGIAELKALKRYTINENIDGRIVKSIVFVGEKQVHWHDAIEKSETGEKIEKGTFLDTELNRSLNRVGETFIKGKGKVEKEEAKEELKFDEAMYKAALTMVKKGGQNKTAMFKAMKEKYKDSDDKTVKGCLNKAYKEIADDYVKKAEEDVEMEVDEKEEGKEKSKK